MQEVVRVGVQRGNRIDKGATRNDLARGAFLLGDHPSEFFEPPFVAFIQIDPQTQELLGGEFIALTTNTVGLRCLRKLLRAQILGECRECRARGRRTALKLVAQRGGEILWSLGDQFAEAPIGRCGSIGLRCDFCHLPSGRAQSSHGTRGERLLDASECIRQGT